MFNRRKRREPTLEEQYPLEFDRNVLEDVAHNKLGRLSPRQLVWIRTQEIRLTPNEFESVYQGIRSSQAISLEISKIIRQRRKILLAQLPRANIVCVKGSPIYDIARGNPPYHVIVIEGAAYPVTATYWRWLRANCERVAVYTIKDWYPPLALTVEPLGIALPTGITLPTPTSDEKLKRALGVGDDGEIIYSDETTIPKES